MAVVEDRWGDEPVEQGNGYGRQPPQDLAAEQSVLGGMLLSKDAIADVVESIKSPDFYKPAHGLIYDAILDLYARGDPADPITVAAELDRAGTLNVSGAPRLPPDTVTLIGPLPGLATPIPKWTRD